jgi:predicted TIM-barrel fold metal-dependent hydrolase
MPHEIKLIKLSDMKPVRFPPFIIIAAMQTIASAAFSQDVDTLKLKDYRPVSIYKIPQTKIEKAKYPVFDFHSHDYPKTDAEVGEWVKTMDEVGIAKSMILTYSSGARFDSAIARYAPYKDRFDVWCGFDYTGYDKPGWQQHAIAELERCHKKGARGVGELGDKGLGEFYSKPTPGWGLHIDDPQMKPLLEKCAELHMPVSIHVAEDAWMYENIDSTNDGLMNSSKWKVDMSKKGILNHDQLVATLEHAVRDNPKTIFIACHLANCCSNLSMLGKLFDTYPNLYADVAARYGEIAPIPRYVHDFIEKYADRIVYGTDMGMDKKMYTTTFHILETADEHFYEHDQFGYHWPLYGLSLSDATLKKIYNGNGEKILKR